MNGLQVINLLYYRCFVRIKDGFIVEELEDFDALSFMGTLGFELQPKAA